MSGKGSRIRPTDHKRFSENFDKIFAKRLPYDCTRCEGKGCDKKESCLRYTSLDDLGPRTPIMSNACEHSNSFLEA